MGKWGWIKVVAILASFENHIIRVHQNLIRIIESFEIPNCPQFKVRSGDVKAKLNFWRLYFPPRFTQKTKNHRTPLHVKNNNFLGLVRKISMTCNLNKPGEYEGGNLKFDFGPHIETGDRYKVCEEIRPQGSVIAFPSFFYFKLFILLVFVWQGRICPFEAKVSSER